MLGAANNDLFLAWKRDSAVLTAGPLRINRNNRIRVVPESGGGSSRENTISYNLEIRDVRLSDGGNYICQIGTTVPKEIGHSLEVLGKCVN